MKKLSKEAAALSYEYHPTSVKFSNAALLAKLAGVSEKVDRSRRQLIENAVSRVLDEYERTGDPAVLEGYNPICLRK
jgi:hypothetical protein